MALSYKQTTEPQTEREKQKMLNMQRTLETYNKLQEDANVLNLDYEMERSIYEIYTDTLTKIFYSDGITNNGSRLVTPEDVKTRSLEWYNAKIGKKVGDILANELNGL